jgi:hypothetical protein
MSGLFIFLACWFFAAVACGVFAARAHYHDQVAFLERRLRRLELAQQLAEHQRTPRHEQSWN